MIEDAVHELRSELGVDPPAELLTLGADRLRELAQFAREAKRQQMTDIDEAIDEALTMLPAMLRRPVKKVLGR